MAPGESMLPGAFCVGLCCGIEVGRRRRKERAAAGRNRRNEPAFFMLYLSSVEGKCRIGFIVTFIEFFFQHLRLFVRFINEKQNRARRK